jgi:hypothetical protein
MSAISCIEFCKLNFYKRKLKVKKIPKSNRKQEDYISGTINNIKGLPLHTLVTRAEI